MKKTTENKLDKISAGMEKIGCLLTALITLPILGVIFFGPAGLIVGIIIGGVIAIGAIGSTISTEKKK